MRYDDEYNLLILISKLDSSILLFFIMLHANKAVMAATYRKQTLTVNVSIYALADIE
jgi:hypothetical protein